jgi:nucleoside-diphosphate-sugar epimerase
MRLLVLGGTAFVGRAIVEAALREQWSVTTFNRGRSGPDIDGVTALRGDRTVSADVAQLAAGGPWDAVVDTSGYVPRNVLDVARALEPAAGRYVFMSTVSVYAGWPVEPLTDDSPILPCPPDAGPDYGEDTEDGPTRYGYQKSGCEAAAVEAFGTDRVSALRLGVVLGPWEYVGRLPWWLRRIARGGQVVAPGEPERSIQPVDVRDLADFALRCAEHGHHGAYNIAAPIGRETFGGMLAACQDASSSAADLVWVPDARLLQLGVRQWSEMPLWRTFPGVWNVAADRADAAGLTCRPLADTVHDTWAWMTRTGTTSDHERATEIGLTAEHDQAIVCWLPCQRPEIGVAGPRL